MLFGTFRRAPWALMLLCHIVPGLHAQEVANPLPLHSTAAAELFLDLEPSSLGAGSVVDGFVEAGGLLHFYRRQELWSTDGTLGGTGMVRELAWDPELRMDGVELPDGRLLFVGHDPASGLEPWISDGTAEGTQPYANIMVGRYDSDPRQFGVGTGSLAGEVFFLATSESDLRSRDHLYATDGSPEGLRRVSDLDVLDWAQAGERLYLLTESGLWVSDGAPDSEEALIEPLDLEDSIAHTPWIEPFLDGVILVTRGADDGVTEVRFGDSQGFEVLYRAEGGASLMATVHGRAFINLACSLLATDGTVVGTTLLAVDGGCPYWLTATSDQLFFVTETAAFGEEVWTSDGTQAGTRITRDICPAGEGSAPTALTALGSELAFLAFDGDGVGLWLSDGSESGTRRIDSFPADTFGSVERGMGRLGDQLLFTPYDPGVGWEPWVYDGSTGDLDLLANLTADAASSLAAVIAQHGDSVVVGRTIDGQHHVIRVDSDGSQHPLYVSTEGRSWKFLDTVQGQLLVVESDGSNYPVIEAWVYAVDVATGTQQELFTPRGVSATVPLGGRRVMFTGQPFGHAGIPFIFDDVWVTDGTVGGTAQVLAPGDDVRVSPANPVAVGDFVYFVGTSEEAGREVWRTDGTVEGTGPVLDLVPGPDGSEPVLGQAQDGRFLVHAGPAAQRALAISDGTPLGTRILDADAQYEFRGGLPMGLWALWMSAPHAYVPSDAVHLFDGQRLHVLDSFEFVESPVVFRDQLYFIAADTHHGAELWVSDGTLEGTRPLVDLEPGAGSSDPSTPQVIDGRLVFEAQTARHGRELWTSDGTAVGTRLLVDLEPGLRGSYPRSSVRGYGDRLLVSAYRSDAGREIYAIPRDTLTGCVPDSTTLCLGDGRFRVTVDWADFVGDAGSARVAHNSEDSGLFYFFQPDNWEMLLKVVDGCGFNGHFWVFSAATTNVEYTLRVTDLVAGVSQEYVNPLGTSAAAITDTEAFATCP